MSRQPNKTQLPTVPELPAQRTSSLRQRSADAREPIRTEKLGTTPASSEPPPPPSSMPVPSSRRGGPNPDDIETLRPTRIEHKEGDVAVLSGLVEPRVLSAARLVTRDERTVLDLIDGQRTLGDIARTIEISVDAVLAIVNGLVEKGLVGFRDEDDAT